MSLPAWKYVDLKTVLAPDNGWHYDDDVAMSKLVASLQWHGQLQPLVVAGDITDDSMVVLVHGHKLLAAMQALGWTQAMAVHLGELTNDAASRVALHLELRFEVDYARLAARIGDLLGNGATVAELASGSPFDAERIGHFMTLRTFDMSQWRQDDGQHRLDWDALAEEPVPDTGLPPPLATAAEGTREAAQVVQVTPPILSPEPLEDVTAVAAAPAPLPATPEPARPGTAEAAPKAAGGPGTPPQAPSSGKPAKPAKAPKAPDAQMGLF